MILEMDQAAAWEASKMQLPKFLTKDQPFQLMQDKWKGILDPLLAKPLSSSSILQDINLVVGTNTFNHLLARQMRGWIIIDQDAAAEIYRSKPFNSTTLTLNSNAIVQISLVVF